MAKRQGEGLKHKLKTLLGLKKTNTVPTIGIDYEEEQIYIFTVDKLKVCYFYIWLIFSRYFTQQPWVNVL